MISKKMEEALNAQINTDAYNQEYLWQKAT